MCRINLVELPQGGQNCLEVVEVEPGADLKVGDFPFPHPFVDGAGADGQPLGEFPLLDQGRGIGRSVHDDAPFAVSTHQFCLRKQIPPEAFPDAPLQFRWQPSFGRGDLEPRLRRFLVHDLPVVAEYHFRGVASLQRGPGDVPGLSHPIADERVSEGILTPSTGNLSFHGDVVESARRIGQFDDLAFGLAPWGQPRFEVLRERHQSAGCRLRLAAGDLDVAAVPLDVLPMEAANLGRPDACECADGHQRQNPRMADEKQALHLGGGENLDFRFRLFERLGQLGGGLPLGV